MIALTGSPLQHQCRPPPAPPLPPPTPTLSRHQGVETPSLSSITTSCLKLFWVSASSHPSCCPHVRPLRPLWTSTSRWLHTPRVVGRVLGGDPWDHRAAPWRTPGEDEEGRTGSPLPHPHQQDSLKVLGATANWTSLDSRCWGWDWDRALTLESQIYVTRRSEAATARRRPRRLAHEPLKCNWESANVPACAHKPPRGCSRAGARGGGVPLRPYCLQIKPKRNKSEALKIHAPLRRGGGSAPVEGAELHFTLFCSSSCISAVCCPSKCVCPVPATPQVPPSPKSWAWVLGPPGTETQNQLQKVLLPAMRTVLRLPSSSMKRRCRGNHWVSQQKLQEVCEA